jgi:acylphosphatase
MKHSNLKIYGKVQGIFYRMAALERAHELNLVGWVRNLEDGTVEIEVQGEKNAIERFIEWCKKGPKGAHVESVEEKTKDVKKISFEDFKIIY